MIKATHLHKSYGEIKAINDLSFEIKQGEVVGLLGPNGAGKSTTMKMITGYLDLDQGNIIIGNQSVKDAKAEIQADIGYLPENCPLYEDFTIQEQLQHAGRMKNIPKSEVYTEIGKVLDLCGLQPRKNMLISQLSKGYKQRTGLACALLGNPKILILDEPTSGLDPNQILEIRKLLSNIAKETKATVIISTHIMQEAESMCDRVIIINNGQIAADGTIDELKTISEKGINIEFETSSNVTDVKSALVGLKNVIDYDNLGKHGKHNKFRVTFEGKDEDIPELLQTLVKSKIGIFSFTPSKQSLEKIFSNLTLN